MANQLPPMPNNPITDVFVWRDWFYKVSQSLLAQATTNWVDLNFTSSNILNIQTRQHNALQDIQGGSGGQYYHLTATEYSNLGSTSNYIEAYDRSTSIALSLTPVLLKPASTGSSNGITYDSSTGEFTFNNAGTYTLSLAVNCLAAASNKLVYIYAENNTGSGWVANQNSGKIITLQNATQTQVSFSNSIYRSAGQKVRYWIYTTDASTTLITTTLPGTTSTAAIYVPAIRIQYS